MTLITPDPTLSTVGRARSADEGARPAGGARDAPPSGEIVSSINDFQMTIASAVEQQTATTAEMSRNVSEAASGTGEIAANISSVATSSQSTTAALTQSRAAIGELARMEAEPRTESGSLR